MRTANRDGLLHGLHPSPDAVRGRVVVEVAVAVVVVVVVVVVAIPSDLIRHQG